MSELAVREQFGWLVAQVAHTLSEAMNSGYDTAAILGEAIARAERVFGGRFYERTGLERAAIDTLAEPYR